MKKQQDLTVLISNRNSTCGECQSELGRGAWIRLEQEKGVLCLSCADLEHLWFLPSGDAALTRRSKKYSNLWAVVLKWSKARKRYERQGLLVEEKAYDRAVEECRSDSELREYRRQKAAVKRAELDEQYIQEFAKKVREYFPNCPKGREEVIAEHACLKYSGRVGRSSAAKEFDKKAVELAVVAHIRHAETNYDDLLGGFYDRVEARRQVQEKVAEILGKWKNDS